jgi:hypothetical protein
MKIAEEIHISAEQDTAVQCDVKFPLEKKRYVAHVLQAD